MVDIKKKGIFLRERFFSFMMVVWLGFFVFLLNLLYKCIFLFIFYLYLIWDDLICKVIICDIIVIYIFIILNLNLLLYVNNEYYSREYLSFNFELLKDKGMVIFVY